jgi:hypothetical protein
MRVGLRSPRPCGTNPTAPRGVCEACSMGSQVFCLLLFHALQTRSPSSFVSQHGHAHPGMRTGRAQGTGLPSARCVSEREHATAAPSLLPSLSLTGQAWTALNRRTSDRAGSAPLSLESVLHLVLQASCSGERCTTNRAVKRPHRLSAVRQHRCYYSCCVRSRSRF